MCWIGCALDQPFDERDLWAACSSNPDGAGVVFRDNGRLRVIRSLDGRDIIKVVKDGLPLPYIVHFRSASVGPKCLRLTQPLAVRPWTGDGATEYLADSVLVHNGHLPSWAKLLLDDVWNTGMIPPSGPWSDTLSLAYLAGRQQKRRARKKLIGRHAGEFGRVMLVEAAGSGVDITYWGRWQRRAGRIMSEDPEIYRWVAWQTRRLARRKLHPWILSETYVNDS